MEDYQTIFKANNTVLHINFLVMQWRFEKTLVEYVDLCLITITSYKYYYKRLLHQDVFLSRTSTQFFLKKNTAHMD